MRFQGLATASVVGWAIAGIVGVAMLACPAGVYPAMFAADTGCVPAIHHRVAAARGFDAPHPFPDVVQVRTQVAFVPGGAAVVPGIPTAPSGSGPSGDPLHGRLSI